MKPKFRTGDEVRVMDRLEAREHAGKKAVISYEAGHGLWSVRFYNGNQAIISGFLLERVAE